MSSFRMRYPAVSVICEVISVVQPGSQCLFDIVVWTRDQLLVARGIAVQTLWEGGVKEGCVSTSPLLRKLWCTLLLRSTAFKQSVNSEKPIVKFVRALLTGEQWAA